MAGTCSTAQCKRARSQIQPAYAITSLAPDCADAIARNPTMSCHIQLGADQPQQRFTLGVQHKGADAACCIEDDDADSRVVQSLALVPVVAATPSDLSCILIQACPVYHSCIKLTKPLMKHAK